jgi:hypothetical protein
MNYARFDDQTSPKKSCIVSNLQQLYLLLWKNVVLQKRSLIGMVLEICVPALFAIILLPIRKIVKSDNYLNDTVFDPFRFDSLPDNLLPSNLYSRRYRDGLWSFGYQPNDSKMLNDIMNSVGANLNLNIYGNFKNKIIYN